VSKLRLGPIGVALNVSDDDGHFKDAAELEALGYDTLWLPGGQIDSLDRIARLVHATSTVPVGSAIIPLDVYQPAEVARLYAELEDTAPGRFVAGLGGPQKSQRPLRALDDYLDRLDQASPPVPAQRRILAALGPRKLELARDRFAGAIPLLVTPAYTRDARHRLGGEPTLIVSQMVVPHTDAERAREAARARLRFLSGVRGYQANFARMGFTSTDIEQLSDHLVDELVTWGDIEAIAARAHEQLAAGADQVALTILGTGSPGAFLDAARQLAGHLLR
jgi:probable F420-dependent oxidoreductase